ncbi:hypothetical protein GOZ97_22765 [Agrobacterium vitis]|uniref:hypothetical protein n=1 Tax=Rhizobium/Agrobacterium group TaxID=227290 RepID=UPI001113DE24|nr:MULTISPECIES: hypothetical protein [Rhizobium/Agrobacterium group]MCF1436817.1 hypothetical protein [Allorhizobium ampelinum]MUO92291.1 hypothetical protein [Agrobacterium vitis]MUZ55112.1 hypothetical protein [Agrobacterium vitis]MUZ94247.1 hypothetical protein [Agrobacterium vitis]MVA42946.1 hypothetical protein [Agrobacterium vitis]
MQDNMQTYRQFLNAQQLAERLLTKHVTEASEGQENEFYAEYVGKAFHDLAASLGYRVEPAELLQRVEAVS